MGNSGKGITNIQADNIHRLSLFHQACHPVTEGDKFGQGGLASHKPMLAEPDPLDIPYTLHDDTQADLP